MCTCSIAVVVKLSSQWGQTKCWLDNLVLEHFSGFVCTLCILFSEFGSCLEQKLHVTFPQVAHLWGVLKLLASLHNMQPSSGFEFGWASVMLCDLAAAVLFDVESEIELDNILIKLLLSKVAGTLVWSEIKAGAFVPYTMCTWNSVYLAALYRTVVLSHLQSNSPAAARALLPFKLPLAYFTSSLYCCPTPTAAPAGQAHCYSSCTTPPQALTSAN